MLEHFFAPKTNRASIDEATARSGTQPLFERRGIPASTAPGRTSTCAARNDRKQP